VAADAFASISPVTDGSHLIAYFGSRGLIACTLDGKLVWQKDLGQLRMHQTFGEGNWPLLAGNTLLIAFDHEGESALIAFDKATGRELWRTPRQAPRLRASRRGRRPSSPSLHRRDAGAGLIRAG
jgi:outer membrane protein assembly factor BamB